MRNFILFPILGCCATGSALANELQFLDHSELAISRLYIDISNASDTIDLTYFEWDPCSSVSKVLLKKLEEKAKGVKPVKVRLLLDSYPYEPHEIDRLGVLFRSKGIDVKFFNPNAGISKVNFRTHSKMTLVDKKIRGKASLVTGGRNMGDSYFGMAEHNYVDRDVAVKGPSSSEDPSGTIAQAENAFNQLWNSKLSAYVPEPPGEKPEPEHCSFYAGKRH